MVATRRIKTGELLMICSPIAFVQRRLQGQEGQETGSEGDTSDGGGTSSSSGDAIPDVSELIER